MAQPVGKRFEDCFKKSIPDNCLLIRLPDPPQAFSQSSLSKFSVKNPCDFILFDTNHHMLVPIELKTTKNKSMSFEDVNVKEQQSKMIHAHQIVGLTKFARYDNVVAGFLFNFRDEKNDCERCYFQRIEDFNKMVDAIDKKSFNEIDLLKNDAIKVDGIKKRVNYRWDIENLLDCIKVRYL